MVGLFGLNDVYTKTKVHGAKEKSKRCLSVLVAHDILCQWKKIDVVGSSKILDSGMVVESVCLDI